MMTRTKYQDLRQGRIDASSHRFRPAALGSGAEELDNTGGDRLQRCLPSGVLAWRCVKGNGKDLLKAVDGAIADMAERFGSLESAGRKMHVFWRRRDDVIRSESDWRWLIAPFILCTPVHNKDN